MDKRLKQLRKTLDLTQQEFADRLGVKRNTIANYETGRNEPVGSIFALICREFGVSEEWLRNGTGEMFVEKNTFSLDEYAQSNNLSDIEISIIRGFIELDPSVRNAIYDVFKEAFSSERSAYDSTSDNSKDIELANLEKEYKKSRSNSASKTTLSASNITEETVKEKHA